MIWVKPKKFRTQRLSPPELANCVSQKKARSDRLYTWLTPLHILTLAPRSLVPMLTWYNNLFLCSFQGPSRLPPVLHRPVRNSEELQFRWGSDAWISALPQLLQTGIGWIIQKLHIKNQVSFGLKLIWGLSNPYKIGSSAPGLPIKHPKQSGLFDLLSWVLGWLIDAPLLLWEPCICIMGWGISDLRELEMTSW